MKRTHPFEATRQHFRSINEAYEVPLQSHRTAKTNSSGRCEWREGNQLLITPYAN